jgi:HK97 family phage major capsid protein
MKKKILLFVTIVAVLACLFALSISAAEPSNSDEFGEVTITPKRLTATLDVSKQFLLQDSNDAEAMLIRDLAGAIAEKLETTIFGDGAGSATQPKGLFNGVTATDSIDAIAYQDVLEVEQALEEKNATEYMFVTSPAVKFALKGVQKGNGLQMVCEGNEIDGIDYVSSNSVLKNGFLALDPKSLVIGQWGGIDILVDPYTKAADGCVRLVVNAYFDAAMKSDRIEAVLFS